LENNKSYDNINDKLSKDKVVTELFIEKAIISLSDMIILVVGKLTRTEQKLITRIKETAKMSNNKIRSIIIIHNLAQYHKIIEVERYIENYLYRSATFNVEKRNVIGNQKYNGRYYFVEQFNKDDNIEIIHYIMAKENTEAGSYYNNLTMELIKEHYNICNNRQKIDIPKKIMEIFSDFSTEIFDETINIEQLEITNDNKIRLKQNILNKNDLIIYESRRNLFKKFRTKI
jgi:hypothetical protein